MNYFGRRIFIIFVFLLVVMTIPFSVHAKVSKVIREAVNEKYTPSLPQPGLIRAQDPLEPDKLRSFVVVDKGGLIPAERAFYLITPQNYDYRGAVIDGDEIKTRKGKPYIYLPRGVIMIVAENVFSGRTIYLKLLSVKKLKSPTNPKKKPTRVTVMLGFKFDKAVLAGDNVDKIFAMMEEWVKPFSTYAEAVTYFNTLGIVNAEVVEGPKKAKPKSIETKPEITETKPPLEEPEPESKKPKPAKPKTKTKRPPKTKVDESAPISI